jgi:hypothetical protein
MTGHHIDQKVQASLMVKHTNVRAAALTTSIEKKHLEPFILLVRSRLLLEHLLLIKLNMSDIRLGNRVVVFKRPFLVLGWIREGDSCETVAAA